MQKIFAWLDDRTGYRALLNKTLYEPIPGGARWRYVWGTTLLFTFMLQVLTGFCLWMSYSPSATTAWESVFYIQHSMTLGWLVRGMHHFAAGAMMILMTLHLMQVVIDGAYKAPREVNFWLGLLLMQLIAVMGVTGYLLPWDQKGYSATQVVTGIIGATPIVGTYIQQLAQGGTQYGNLNLTRFFALHAGILPAAVLGVLALHLYVFRRHGQCTVPSKRNPDDKTVHTYWPDQFLRDAIACMAVLIAIIGTTFFWGGAELSAPADPAEAYSAARPEWYYLFLFKFLSIPWVARVGVVTHLGESFGAVIVPGLVITVIALMPLIARWRYGHRFNVSFMWVVVGIVGVLTGMAVHADWIADNQEGRDFRLAVKQAHIDALRVTELAHSPMGIPPEGAANLLRRDPLTQGPKFFQTYCINCHQPEDKKDQFAEPPVAPELADPQNRTKITFASREWTKSVLVNFEKHFSALANTKGDFAEAANTILTGSMKDWSDSNRETLTNPENANDLAALVEFIYTQSGRPDSLSPDHETVQRGLKIFTTGEMTNGTIDSCVDCHSMKPVVLVDDVRQYAEESLAEGLYPDLTGYGGVDWLKKMIATPHAVYAGDSGNNAMPAFESQLTPSEVEILARWLAYDYHPTAEGNKPAAQPAK